MRSAAAIAVSMLAAGCVSYGGYGIEPGLDAEAVQRIVGPPGRTEDFPRTGELVWDYRFMDSWGYSSYFSVVFDTQRRVRQAFTWREQLDQMD